MVGLGAVLIQEIDMLVEVFRRLNDVILRQRKGPKRSYGPVNVFMYTCMEGTSRKVVLAALVFLKK